MTSVWQSCQGDYKPQDVFVRGDQTVITRNIKEVEDGLWQWEECAMLTADYEAIHTIMNDAAPYTETKTAYYKETEKTFYDVPEGNVTVYFDNYNGAYSFKRVENRLTVLFDALENKTDITISIK